jgi:NADPH2:quinone reductase
MKAIRIDETGGLDVLRLVELPAPTPRSGEVTIDVEFAGAGLVDVLFRRGDLPIPLPMTPGIEVAGRIREVGSEVEGFTPGEPVAALLNDFVNLPGAGGYAQVAMARAALTIARPDGCDAALAATVLVNGTTAWLALRNVAQIRPDEPVVVLGATGGLGSMVGRLARGMTTGRMLGLVGGPGGKEAARALGYDVVATNDELEDALQQLGPVGLAFDTVGDGPRSTVFDRLAPRGRLVILGDASGADTAVPGDQIWLGNRTLHGLNVGGLTHLDPELVAEAATEALAWAAANRGEVAPSRIIRLEEAAEAHRLLESHQAGGKIVLAAAP